MRPTLHEYNLQKLSDLDCTAISDVLNFTKLTNRAPRLGDFVPCDEDGNVLEKPNPLSYYSDICGYQHGQNKIAQYKAAQDIVIFAGDWEVKTIIGTNELISDGSNSFIWENGICKHFNKCYKPVTRIEDLPREIEFKDGVI